MRLIGVCIIDGAEAAGGRCIVLCDAAANPVPAGSPVECDAEQFGLLLRELLPWMPGQWGTAAVTAAPMGHPPTEAQA